MKKYYQPDMVARHVPMQPIPDVVSARLLRPGELLARQAAFPVAFLPVGTLEWHGRQNPIGCDTIKAERLCEETARNIGGVLMPSLYLSMDAYRDVGHGYGPGMDAEAGFLLPGSFYAIETELFQRYLRNACENYLARGFEMVLIVSGHNPTIQQNTIDEVCYAMKSPEGAEPVIFTMEYAVLPWEHPLCRPDHAAAYETSMMRYHVGDRVDMTANQGQEIESLAINGDYFGDATAELGKACFEAQVEGLSAMAQQKLAALRQAKTRE